MSQTWEQSAARAVAILNRHRLPAYIVKLEPGDSPRTANKALGSAYLLPGEVWPRCPYCKHKLTLLLQVAVADIAEVAPGLDHRGLLQLFYCVNQREMPADGGPMCNGTFGWDIKEDNNVARVVVPDGEGSLDEPPDHRETENYTIKRRFGGVQTITPYRVGSLEQILDYPSFDEYQAFLPGTLIDEIGNLESDVEKRREFYETYCAARGIKIGGHPTWIQYPEWPQCGCGDTMRCIMSFSPDEHLRLAGDKYLYVFYCEKHPQKFALEIQNT